MDAMPPGVEEIGRELIARLFAERRLDLVERVFIDVVSARLRAWIAIEQEKYELELMYGTGAAKPIGVFCADCSQETV